MKRKITLKAKKHIIYTKKMFSTGFSKYFQHALSVSLNYQKISETIEKEYQKLNLFMTNITGKK